MGGCGRGQAGQGHYFLDQNLFLLQGTKSFQQEYHMYIVWQKYSRIKFYCLYCKSKFQIFIYVLYYVLNLFQSTKTVVLLYYKAGIVLTIYMKICFYIRKRIQNFDFIFFISLVSRTTNIQEDTRHKRHMCFSCFRKVMSSGVTVSCCSCCSCDDPWIDID